MNGVPPPVVFGGSGELGSLPSVDGGLDSDEFLMLPGGESPLPGGQAATFDRDVRAEAFDGGEDAPWMQVPGPADTSKRSRDVAGFRSREYDSTGSLGALGDFVNGGSLNSGGMQELLGFDYQSAAACSGDASSGGRHPVDGGRHGDPSMHSFQPPQIGGGSGSMASPRGSIPSIGSMSVVNSEDMAALFSGSDGPVPPTPPSRRQGVLDARPPGNSSDEEDDDEVQGDLQSLRLGGDVEDAGFHLRPRGVGTDDEDDEDKPHRCPVPGCGYAAKGSGHLKRHMRTHTGEKPFKCSWEGCTYASSQSTHLTAHMRKHTGERPFGCPVAGCDYSAARSWHVTRHMQRQHPDAVAAGLKATGKSGLPSDAPTGGGGGGGGAAKTAPAASRVRGTSAARGKETKGGGTGAKLSAMMKRKQVKTEAPDLSGFGDLGQQLQVEPQALMQHQPGPLHGQPDEQLPSYDDATLFGGAAGAMLPRPGQPPQHATMAAMLPLDGSEQDWAAVPPPSYDEVVGESDLG